MVHFQEQVFQIQKASFPQEVSKKHKGIATSLNFSSFTIECNHQETIKKGVLIGRKSIRSVVIDTEMHQFGFLDTVCQSLHETTNRIQIFFSGQSQSKALLRHRISCCKNIVDGSFRQALPRLDSETYFSMAGQDFLVHLW
jgi:hypothetical protein